MFRGVRRFCIAFEQSIVSSFKREKGKKREKEVQEGEEIEEDVDCPRFVWREGGGKAEADRYLIGLI